ncbi:hypothetical protein BO70DRAFT_393500 [Aspergillus heteromorphus CBS 117.55]|uniref:Uncharacterized protein n=1 Tax=Aspergillus heteromorphus CBS 117.55 TaxID=1448321 RepID=A0A317WUK5_9EURO|nr:uncharacterized protein BO70DRAFT_393500 [Aspergillus heteromorphus CBS 117.55]PWY88982.1 hypothetical protein BO70DRAFT_393500 [Aspergillus heteromorphus CBS 117.55]
MKPSTVLLCLVPTIALAADQAPPPPATPSLPNANPPAPLPQIPTPINNPDDDDDSTLHLEVRQVQAVADSDATRVLDQWPEPASGTIGLGTLTSSPGKTKALRARSEGTLGQTPWIGMAIGLTCTALAAVMLG